MEDCCKVACMTKAQRKRARAFWKIVVGPLSDEAPLLKNKKATGRPKDQLDVALLTKALKDRAGPTPKKRRPARSRGKLK